MLICMKPIDSETTNMKLRVDSLQKKTLWCFLVIFIV